MINKLKEYVQVAKEAEKYIKRIIVEMFTIGSTIWSVKYSTTYDDTVI